MTETSRSNQLRVLRRAAWAAAAAFLLATGGLLAWRTLGPASGPVARVTGEALIASDFALTDHTGRRVTEADFAGRWQLVFFGFTYCPDICPTTLAYLARVLDLLGDQADRVAPLFITVDPARDTPEVMAAFVAAFHPRLIGLTGTDDEIAAAAKAFRVYYERMDQADAPDGYLMAHAGYLYLMSPAGRFETVFREGDGTAEELAEDILNRIAKEARS
jgi:cytochrome oxidase Cu insertion factor (SCO1/SenC/PrrC family)